MAGYFVGFAQRIHLNRKIDVRKFPLPSYVRICPQIRLTRFAIRRECQAKSA